MNPTTPGKHQPKNRQPSENHPNADSEGLSSLHAYPVSLKRYLLFFSIIIAGTAVDLSTKQYAFQRYFSADSDNASEPIPLIGEWLGIQTSTNQGALFGMGQGLSVVFAVLSVVAFSVLIYLLFVKRWGNDLFIVITFAMIAGGIFGNLYDRLGFWHDADIGEKHQNAVRDWIHFNWEGGPKIFNPWPNFNIADCLLVCGAILLCIHAFFFQPELDTPSPTSDSNSESPSDSSEK